MHTTDTKPTVTPRRVGAAVLLGLTLLAALSLIFQPASAQRSSGELKPPFTIRQGNVQRPSDGVPPLPLTAPIIVSETFDANFDPLPSSQGVGWHTINYDGEVSGYTWGRVVGAPITDSVWVAATRWPLTLPELTAGEPYTNNMDALLVYGPIDMSNYGSAIVSFTYRLDSAPGDFLGVAYSTDGTYFDSLSAEDNSVDPTLSQKRTGYVNVSPMARKGLVWLAFYFDTNADDQLGLGAFIEDVVLRAVPLYRIYMPVMRLDAPPTPTPTHTPTATPVSQFIYNYTFGTGANTDSQFLAWGGKTNYSCGTSCTVIQDVSTNGNPSGAINFSQGGKDTIVGTGPNHTLPTNFELSADFMLVEGKIDGRFGLVFGASDSTFYLNGSAVVMDPTRNYYKFDLNIDLTDETLIKAYRVQRYDNGSATNIQPGTDFPAGIVRGLGQWNTVKIIRQGSNIQVLVNSWPAVNINDGTFVGARKFGVQLHSRATNNEANPLKIRFDNVTVRQLP